MQVLNNTGIGFREKEINQQILNKPEC